MNETKKATARRSKDLTFPWGQIFSGKGLDVGCGPDLLVWPGAEVRPFDLEHGDANHLDRHVEPGSLDFLHASQCLEHMHDPLAAFGSWAVCVRPGGYLVVTVPDLVLYGDFRWPSAPNPDHKTSWSLFYKKAPCPNHQYVPDFIEATRLLCPRAELIDTDYDYSRLGDGYDQTFYEPYAEAFIEMVFKK